ncbi:MAG: type II toxin-antitoxin system prevent-host-death family antitoxin [Deltaproteobacteria bacterium]|jgi:prevent-host-death family protein|nr:type II toxin-antitoxin system prevent-host-death family antitoxin [Deltaproteobacteria bacterium]
MERIGTHEAKTRLSELLAKVRKGQEFLITNRGEPVAKLLPASKPDQSQIRLAIKEIREIQSRNRLDGLKIRDMIDEGRRA